MNYPILWTSILLITLASVAMFRDPFQNVAAMGALMWRLSESVNSFTMDSHAKMVRNKEENIIYSPISITNTLAMIHFGARGRTARELEKALFYPKVNFTKSSAARAYRHLLTHYLIPNKKSHYAFDLANAIVINNYSVSPAFKEKIEEFYKAPIKVVDFVTEEKQTTKEINEWVKGKTRNKIKKIVGELNPNSQLVFLNTAYLKAQWWSSFNIGKTKEGNFFNGGVHKTTVLMMEQENYFFYSIGLEMSVLEMPFKGYNLTMVFLLPHRQKSLQQIEKDLNIHKVQEYIEVMRLTRVRVVMPKFSISYSAELKPSLKSMGVNRIFNPKLANLTGMIPKGSVSVGEIKHKAVIDVDEFGIEASAVTAAIPTRSFKPTEIEEQFIMDHPFLFVILDKRNIMCLFVGRVWNL